MGNKTNNWELEYRKLELKHHFPEQKNIILIKK